MAAKLLLLTLVAFCAINSMEAAPSKKKYIAILQPSTFFEAWQECNIKGGFLASIESKQEQLLVEEAMSKTRNEKAVYFLGGTDIGYKGRYMWIGLGQAFAEDGYRNFYPGEPNNLGGNQRCLSVGNWVGYNRGKWDDTECDKALDGYVCAFRV